MRKLWPELLILILFLTSDLLWDGIYSAVATISAGIIAFLVLLVLGTRKPTLLFEGIGFGLLILAGEFVTYPGGSVLFFELVFSLVLLLPTLFDKSILLAFIGDIGKGLFSKQEALRLSKIMGSVLLLHTIICTCLALLDLFFWWLGLAIFILIYSIVLLKTKKGTQSISLQKLSTLLKKDEGVYVLLLEDVEIATISMFYDHPSSVTIEVLALNSTVHQFLRELESSLKRLKVRTVAINNWQEDSIELEMDGYSVFHETWKKKLI